jgi:hypothetical protein
VFSQLPRARPGSRLVVHFAEVPVLTEQAVQGAAGIEDGQVVLSGSGSRYQ